MYFEYDEPLFRPPSEAHSLIFQVTLGCSWNRCTFCEMYKTKNYTEKNFSVIESEIEKMAELFPDARKIFLADGDAFQLKSEKLIKILNKINRVFPKLQRISSYALPKNINSKSQSELKEIHDAGLKLLYIGIESGYDNLLKIIKKGETQKTTIEGCLSAKQASIKSSVMIINGLGGKSHSHNHAIESAKVLNEIQPDYASTLVLMSSSKKQDNFFQSYFNNTYVPMTQNDLFKEVKILIENTNLESTIFRSDHASNYLVLKGRLNKDKQKILQQINDAIISPKSSFLREEWQRGL